MSRRCRRRTVAANREGGQIAHVVVIHDRPVTVGRGPKVAVACVERRQLPRFSVLPLTVDRRRGGIRASSHLGRVAGKGAVVEASQPLVEMILLRVAAALVKQGDVAVRPVILDARQRDAACMSNHLLRRARVNAARHVLKAGVGAAELHEDVVLCRPKPILERPEDVLVDEEGGTRANVGAACSGPGEVTQERSPRGAARHWIASIRRPGWRRRWTQHRRGRNHGDGNLLTSVAVCTDVADEVQDALSGEGKVGGAAICGGDHLGGGDAVLKVGCGGRPVDRVHASP